MYALLLDLETTGLDEKNCVPIEIAARVIESPNGEEKGRYSTLIRPGLGAVAGGEDYALNMHKASGLLDRAVDHGDHLEIVDSRLLDFVNQYCGDDKVYLMGNSIHFDAKFIRAHMPKLAGRVHYRQIDVTSVNLFINFFTGSDPMTWEKKKAHTADADLDETWQEANAYRDMLKLHPDK